MQADFHYYATYCASCLAGFSHEESLIIAKSAQFVDLCSYTLLKQVGAPLSAATTQLQGELIDARTDILGLQDITRIWASFHFPPRDLKAEVKSLSPTYRNKYRLICGPNGDIIQKTIELAQDEPLESIGIAMHILADSWAHMYFAGTPSQVINNTNFDFCELIEEDGKETERQIHFVHKLNAKDDPEKGIYINSITNGEENFIMNLGHGHAGHLPDYSFAKYRYLPAWGNYRSIVKDNPSDYYHAFCQMIYAEKYLRGIFPDFKTEHYDFEATEPYKDRIMEIIRKRRLDASEDWKAFGESLSGREIPPFELSDCISDYTLTPADQKDSTFLGHFTIGAMNQKSMVTKQIYESGNLLAGISIDYRKFGRKGNKDYHKLINHKRKE